MYFKGVEEGTLEVFEELAGIGVIQKKKLKKKTFDMCCLGGNHHKSNTTFTQIIGVDFTNLSWYGLFSHANLEVAKKLIFKSASLLQTGFLSS